MPKKKRTKSVKPKTRNKRKADKRKAAKRVKIAKKKSAWKAAAPKRDLMAEFQQALELVMGGYLFDAVKAFDGVAKGDPRGELADDAIMNRGLCYLKMNLFHDSISCFTSVIQGYPDATILDAPGAQEQGRTAAKALLARIRCHLALGDTASAKADLKSLQTYDDSYVIDNEGNKRTFHSLAQQTLEVAQSAL